MRAAGSRIAVGIAVGMAVALGGSCDAGPPPELAPPAARSSTAGANGSVPTPGTLHHDRTLVHDGVSRTFHFYEAGGHEASPRPLVLVLHGGFATIDAFIGKPTGAAPLAGAWLSIAEREGLHVAIPQAMNPGRGAHWNDCRRDCTHCGEQDDVGFLVELVRTLSAQVGVDPERVYVSGESNGGYMTFRLAKERPELFAAFGTVSALMPAQDECAPPSGPVNLAIVAGTKDKAVKYAGGGSRIRASGTNLSADDTIALWRRRNGCDAPPQATKLPDGNKGDDSTVTRYRHACPKTGTELVLYRVDGGGHVVPSVTERVTAAWELVAGRQNHDIETADEHWRFFAAHPK